MVGGGGAVARSDDLRAGVKQVVGEIGETDLCPRPDDADGANDEADAVLLAAKTCSMCERMLARVALPLAMLGGVALRRGFLCWNSARRSRRASRTRFALDR